MSKIAVITGSARKKGNSFAMTDAFIRKAEAAGHTVSRFDAAFANLNGCHGCMTCYSTGRPCTFDDDFNGFADRILDADVLVFAFPVYWYTLPGQIKNVLDKMFAFYVGKKDFGGKKVFVISCAEESDDSVFNGVRFVFDRSCALCGWDLAGEVFVGGVMEEGAIRGTDGCERAARLVDLI